MFIKEIKFIWLTKDDIYSGYYGDNTNETKKVQIMQPDDEGKLEYDLDVIRKILKSKGQFREWTPTPKDRTRLILLNQELSSKRNTK